MTARRSAGSPHPSKPLLGTSVLVTRSAEQAPRLSSALRRLGARVVEAPAIVLAPPRSWAAVDRSLRLLDAGAYDWLVLTSANGVRFLFERLDALGLRMPSGRKTSIAAVGPGTATALRSRGVRTALVPETFTTSSIGRALPRGNGRVLLARADRTEPGLEEALVKRGWSPQRVVLYRLLRAPRLDPAVKTMLIAGGIDIVTFASGGTVHAFARLLGRPLPPAVRVACIGPVTARAARELGIRVDAVATEHTIAGLALAAARAHSRPPRSR